MKVSCNAEQQCYVVNLGAAGYSARGFSSLFKETKELAHRLKMPELAPTEQEFGTLAAYEKHHQLLQLAKERRLGTWFHRDTPAKVRKVLEACRKNGEQIRLFYGDAKSGRSWLDECDMVGTVGRSTGVLQVPLLVAEGDLGGLPILDDCVIRITRVHDHAELYRHPNYHIGKVKMVETSDSRLPITVLVDGKVHARCKDWGEAGHLVAFLEGRVNEPTCLAA